MRKRIKVISLILTVVLLGTLPQMPAIASNTESAMRQEGDNVEQPSTVNDESIGQEKTEEAENGGQVNNEANPEMSDQDVKAESINESKLAYLYVDQSVLYVPNKQKIAVALQDEAVKIQKAQIVYSSTDTGEVIEVGASNYINNTVLFECDFTNVEEIGNYRIQSVVYQSENMEKSIIDISAEGIVAEFIVLPEPQKMEVNGADINVFTIDQVGNEFKQSGSQDNIAEVVESVVGDAGVSVPESEEPRRARTAMNSKAGEIVVAINAGHESGGHNTGASANGLREEDLTLKVAQYCKEELESYSGIRVYMVRPGTGCPVGASTTKECVKNRVYAARNAGAQVFIDIHFNAINGISTSANGSEIFYPGGDTNAQGLSNSILAQLQALGLSNRGAKADNEYWTITTASECGFPGLIVEHAFLDNADDAAKLKDENFLKALGVADATGIAKAYNLSKVGLTIEKNDFDGTFKVKINGDISNLDKYSAAVWCEDNGQDDLLWYEFKKQNSTLAIVDSSVKKHKQEFGRYVVHLYYGGAYVTATTFVITSSTAAFSINDINKNETEYELALNISNVPSDLKNINFAVWSDDKGQDDLKWFTAECAGDVWKSKIRIEEFRKTGIYNVHVYAEYVSGSSVFLESKTFNVTKPSGKITAKAGDGSIEVTISDLNVPSGIEKLSVPVWSKENQEDIYWYTAQRVNEKTFKVKVLMENHRYNLGNYNIHVYVCGQNRTETFIGSIIEKMVTPDATISVKNSDGKQNKYELSTGNLSGYGELQKAQFAVWSDKNGQDDLVWYEGVRNHDGTWKTSVDIVNHRTSGKYNVHGYITLKSGENRFLNAIIFNVDSPTAIITSREYDINSGTITITIDNIVTKSDVKKISIAAWSKDMQEDIYWYEAKKISEREYKVVIDLKNHNFNYGTYQIHGYAQCVNGVENFLGAISTNVKASIAKLRATDVTGEQKNFEISISDLGVYSSATSVKYAVWSEKNGQDDLLWYETTKNNGSYSTKINISDHKTIGTYNVHAYAQLSGGKSVYLGETQFEVTPPRANLYVEKFDLLEGKFEVTIKNISTRSGISQITLAVWSKNNQEDIYWYSASKVSNDTYKVTVNISRHNMNLGRYSMHGYLLDGNGINSYLGYTDYQIVLPSTDIEIINKDGMQLEYEVSNKVTTTCFNVQKVEYAVWSQVNGQDDIKWYGAVTTDKKKWSAPVPISNHRNSGRYNVHVYATFANGTKCFLGAETFNVESLKAEVAIQNVNSTSGEFEILININSSKTGISSIQVPVWCSANQSDIVWYNAEKTSDTTYIVRVDPVNHGSHAGIYTIHVYANEKNGVTTFVDGKTQEVKNALYSIMGPTNERLVSNLVAYYRANNPMYDKFSKYGTQYDGTMLRGGAPTIESYCQIFIQEAQAEGVRGEVAFAQAMLETGFLKYGGDVKPNQYNFAGLGATGGVPGNSFVDVRQGIRAQIQHLKCYASVTALNNPCVDPRWQAWLRGLAPYVQWLSSKTNPYGVGWATDPGYSAKILNGIEILMKF